jgi:hypothetical protein
MTKKEPEDAIEVERATIAQMKKEEQRDNTLDYESDEDLEKEQRYMQFMFEHPNKFGL